MKVNKKVVLAVAGYMVVAFVAYVVFFNYNYSKYEEYVAIERAELAARGWSPEFYDKYLDHGFLSTVWGRDVVNVGIVLGFVSLFVIMAIFLLLDRKKMP